MLPDTPADVRHQTIRDAITELRSGLSYFVMAFESAPGKKTQNPLFGNLDFEENIHLLYKHAKHHLKQFGLLTPDTAG